MIERKKFDLEERLVIFSVQISNLADSLPNNHIGKYISGQIIRSGLSPALNYGEAKSAESINDFIHKMKVALKELRETFISLKIIERKRFPGSMDSVNFCMNECNELISIFVKSIKTAETNKKREK